MTESGRSLDERVETEQTRDVRQYQSRSARTDPFKYSPMNPADQFLRNGRRRTAFKYLRRAGQNVNASTRCLEIGYGTCGWLVEFLTLGVNPKNISGIELHEDRAAVAQELLPTADLRVGNAVDLPWPDDTFQLIVASVVFSSVLDDEVQEQIGREMLRVLAPDGVILVYDLRVPRRKKSMTRAVRRSDLERILGPTEQASRSETLLPPLTRLLAGRFPTTAATIETLMPPLRTHRVSIFSRPESST